MKDFITEQVQQLMSWVVPDVEECRRTAEEMLARRPDAPRDELARELVRYAQKRAAAVGGVTGLAASPVAMVPAALADIAAVLKIEGTMVGGVAALLDPRHAGRTYTLTGPETLSAPEQAAVLADVLGRPVPLHDLSPQERLEQLRAAGLSEHYADGLMAAARFIQEGGNDVVTGDVREVLDRPARTYRQWAEDHASAFAQG